MAKMSSGKSTVGRPFKKGGDPRQGRGPKKGAPNAGRPPDKFKALMAELAQDPDSIEQLRDILRDGDHAAYMKAREYVTERGFGKVPTETTVRGDKDAPIRIVIERE